MLADLLQEAVDPFVEDEEDPETLQKRLKHAQSMLKKAQQRKDEKATKWWQGVEQRTKTALQKAKAGGEGEGKGGEGEGGAPAKGGAQGGEEGGGESAGKIKQFASKLKEKGGKAAEAFKNLPQNGKKFFSVGHLTITALASHWAAETAIKAVGHSALFAHVVGSDFDLLTADKGDKKEALSDYLERALAG